MRSILVVLLMVAVALAGCASDDPADKTVTGNKQQEPGFESVQPATATALEHVAQLKLEDGSPFPTAAGIWAYGDYVYGSARGARIFIADVSDPTAPELVFWAEEDSVTAYARDVDIVEVGARRILVVATQSDGMHVWDVSNPAKSTWLSRVEVNPNHNIAVVPGTTLVFNSQSGGAGGTNDLIDVRNPEFPEVVGTFGTHGCHDISFFQSETKFRAYCAGIERTEIWNLDNMDVAEPDFGITVMGTIGGCPLDLSLVTCTLNSPVVGNPVLSAYPLRTLHHLAMVNEDGTILIVGDEHNGGGAPGMCLAYESTTDISTPLGALWFYDISNEEEPQLLSWLSPELVFPDLGAINPGNTDPTNPGGILNILPNCTAHFGTLVPGEEKMVMAWYSAGILLIDFSDPSTPEIMDNPRLEGTNPWDARVHGGYVFTGDIGRGMDVFRLV